MCAGYFAEVINFQTEVGCFKASSSLSCFLTVLAFKREKSVQKTLKKVFQKGAQRKLSFALLGNVVQHHTVNTISTFVKENLPVIS